MNCNNCGAPMKLVLDRQHFYCEYCASILYPQENEDGIRILDQESNTPCPVCDIPLVYGYIGNTQILTCQKCKGILFDMEIFLMVINYIRANSTDPVLTLPAVNLDEMKRAVSCPECGQRMSTHPYGGPGNLIVDNCIHCNLLWLDYKELERIFRAPAYRHITLPEVDDEEQ
jgi:Zn-finger nucleic acid-binding protein